MNTRSLRQAGVEINVDSDEFQEWYRAFTTFPGQAISGGAETQERALKQLPYHLPVAGISV